jgi:glycosyltransferase involved in cell wall biosynthesis
VPARIWDRWLFGPRGCSGLVALSERIAEAARAELGGDAGRVAAVPGVVDEETYRPRPADPRIVAELGLEAGQRVIGVVARLQPHRRFDLLLEAFRRAVASAPGLRLVVVGRGTRAREVLEQPLERLGLCDSVIRAGYRGNDYRDVLALFAALVFLVPGSDGSCRAVLEAMSMGIPTVASRRGLLPETVVDGETGRLVDEDEGALAEALLEVWRDPAGWETRGKAARRRVLQRHTRARQARRLLDFYEELCSWSSDSSR